MEQLTQMDTVASAAQPLKQQHRYLEGKFAVVTGGARGIGRGIALKLGEKGATVAVNYISNEAAAKQTLAEIRNLGADGFVVQADVSKPDAITAMMERVQ